LKDGHDPSRLRVNVSCPCGRSWGLGRSRLVWGEAAFDYEGQGRFQAYAGRYEGLNPEAVKAFGLVFGLGEEAIEGFEFPEALEVFAVQALAVFFDKSLRFFVFRFVAHLAKPSFLSIL
jgi:hypothetical protein